MRSNSKLSELRLAIDLLRTTLCTGNVAGRPAFTTLPAPVQDVLLCRMRRHPVFDTEVDPDGEHCAGFASADGYTLAWRILYYDGRQPGFTGKSPDPSDPLMTRRVLMLDCIRTPVEAGSV